MAPSGVGEGVWHPLGAGGGEGAWHPLEQLQTDAVWGGPLSCHLWRASCYYNAYISECQYWVAGVGMATTAWSCVDEFYAHWPQLGGLSIVLFSVVSLYSGVDLYQACGGGGGGRGWWALMVRGGLIRTHIGCNTCINLRPPPSFCDMNLTPVPSAFTQDWVCTCTYWLWVVA